nr:conserved hypothetical protein [Hymenolepis microstoma]
MGASLADRLEAIATEKKLSNVQVKRLLKDVLTNPVVVKAFKQYMSGELTLLEPETGAASTSTQKQAKFLGFDLSAFGPNSYFMDTWCRRRVTRSLTKKLKTEVAKKRQQELKSIPKDSVTSTLDMEFTDEDDEEEEVVEKVQSQSWPSDTLSTEETVNDFLSLNSTHPRQRDEDYQPTDEDITVIRRDILYDLEGVEAKSSSTEDEDDSLNESLVTVTSLDSPQRDYYLRSRKSDERCLAGLTPNILHMLDEDDPVAETTTERDAQHFADSFANATAAANNLTNETDDPEEEMYAMFIKSICSKSQQSGEDTSSTPRADNFAIASVSDNSSYEMTDPEDEIYAKFIKSIRQSAAVTQAHENLHDPMVNQRTVNKAFDTPNAVMLGQVRQGGLNDSKAVIDDDPDFDVMAELEDLRYDDFFDELRSDRAVRVSKTEAKELREDTADFLHNDREIFNFETPSNTAPSTANEVHHEEDEYIVSYPPLPPPPFESQTNDRLRRQLTMHLQLLCSTLLVCSHRVDLEASVCNAIRMSFTDFYSAFQDAKSNPLSYVTNLSELNDTFSSAYAFMLEFAGLSILPLPPRINSNSAFNPPLIPLPFTVLDFVLRSPIWAYPQLLPRGLASRPHTLSKKFFTDDEDCLLVLGLANIIEFAPHKFQLFLETLNCGEKIKAAKRSEKTDSRKSKVYSYIRKSLIPTKSTIQLQNRKNYIENDIRKDKFGVRRSSKSSFYLLLCDLTSGNFSDLESQRGLLRLCVTNFASRTISGSSLNQEVGGSVVAVQIGSTFSRPLCWKKLPPEYAQCCMVLHKQVVLGQTGTPQPTIEALLPKYLSAIKGMQHFFLEAMLTWWPTTEPVETIEQDNEEERCEVDRRFVKEECPERDAPVTSDRNPSIPRCSSPSTNTGLPSTVTAVPSTSHQQAVQVVVTNTVSPMLVPTVLQQPTTSALPMPLLNVVLCQMPLSTTHLQQRPVSDGFTSNVAAAQTIPPDSQPQTNNKGTPAREPAPKPYLKPVLAKPPVSKKNAEHSRQKISAKRAITLTRSTPKQPPSFLPQVGKTVSSFHIVLDRGLRGLALPACTSESSDTARLLRRCRRESPAWLPNIPKTITVADESDVRRARCLLDRIHMHLGHQVYTQVVLALREDPPFLECILHLLSPSRPLWEEFINLCLTHGQARSLQLYPIYAHLRRVGEIHSLLKASLPRATRLWARLRKLADSRESEELRIPATDEAPSLSDSLLRHPKKRRRRRRKRLSGEDEQEEKQKPAIDVYRTAWSLLETALKDRFTLLAQTAISLDPMQKPYSNFPQTFEVVDTLARKKISSVGVESSRINLLQNDSGSLPAPLPRLVEHPSFVETSQWETSTELSSNAPTIVKSKSANRCPCPCHIGKAVKTEIFQLQTPSPVGRSAAKADSLGMRHCIRCSLRVQQGILYVDECNFHLNHVKISWPDGFVPPSTSINTFSSNSLNNTALPSCLTTTSASAQQALQALGEYVESSTLSNTQTCEISVPDLAKRQVSVNFEELVLPQTWKVHDLPGSISESLAVEQDEEEEEEEIEEEADSQGGDDFLFDEPCENSPSFFQPPPIEIDDEACFNTEAFYQRNEETDDTEDEIGNEKKKVVVPIPSSVPRRQQCTLNTAEEVETEATWSMAEDRKLLEYFNGIENCTANHFRDLAAEWPQRSPQELAARFKYLMLVAYGEDCTIGDLTKSLEQDQSKDGGSEAREEDYMYTIRL